MLTHTVFLSDVSVGDDYFFYRDSVIILRQVNEIQSVWEIVAIEKDCMSADVFYLREKDGLITL